MNPKYVGDCSVAEVPGSQLTQKRGQAATLIRVFEGSADDLDAFLRSNPVLSTDEYIPSMVLDEYHCEFDGPQVKVTLTYYGLPSILGGSASQLQSNVRWYPRCAQLGTDNPADGIYSVNYKAPTITYRYTASSRLSDPQYEDASESPSDIVISDAQQISIPGGGPPDPKYVRQGNFVYSAFSVCDDFQRDQKGNIYNYSETWAVIIQRPGTASAGTLSLDGAIAPSSVGG